MTNLQAVAVDLANSHTLGPWEVYHGGLVVAENKSVAVAYSIKDEGEMLANARLIAAAPELLEALKELESLGSLELPQRRDAALLKAKAAIAKATAE